MPDLAVIYMPTAGHHTTYLSACMRYCHTRGYLLAGVVTGDPAAVLSMLDAGEATIVVVPRPDHVQAVWLRRIEAALPVEAADHTVPPRAPAASRQRRPRRV